MKSGCDFILMLCMPLTNIAMPPASIPLWLIAFTSPSKFICMFSSAPTVAGRIDWVLAVVKALSECSLYAGLALVVGCILIDRLLRPNMGTSCWSNPGASMRKIPSSLLTLSSKLPSSSLMATLSVPMSVMRLPANFSPVLLLVTVPFRFICAMVAKGSDEQNRAKVIYRMFIGCWLNLFLNGFKYYSVQPECT